MTETSMLRAVDEYIHQGKTEIQAEMTMLPMLSGSCDASNVRGLPLYSAVLMTPSNKAFWCPPQVLASPIPPVARCPASSAELRGPPRSRCITPLCNPYRT
jgi:hypothetical protein